MFDDRFAIHERIRNNFLESLGWKLPWGAAGDFLLVIYMIIGLALLPVFLKLFKSQRVTFYLFITGVGFAGISVVMDSFNIEKMGKATLRFEQSLEQILQVEASSFFATAVLLVLINEIKQLYAQEYH
ncbi:MAG: hypothetical protein ABEJ65_12935 [bacterium]